ncbi:MAG: hypothetical protein CSA68_01080 [Rhodobacterales bacterium]|nr:MAG: hypothetical protein CSA68_01080 [Rhodobacterales bacterium]
MRKLVGGLVFVVGVGGLWYWGGKSYSPDMESQISERAVAAVAAQNGQHPVSITVGGRDISATGTVDSQAELDKLYAVLDNVKGRRVVNLDGIKVLPLRDPYETALSKSAKDAALVAAGSGPSVTKISGLSDMGIQKTDMLELAAGARSDWGDVMKAGQSALAPLDNGRFSLKGNKIELTGQAATPAEEKAALDALAMLPVDMEKVSKIEVLDPGIVDFVMEYDAGQGPVLNGIVPKAVGAKGMEAALGLPMATQKIGTTFAEHPDLTARLAALKGELGSLNRFRLSGSNDKLVLEAEPMPGLDAALVKAQLEKALGERGTVKLAQLGSVPEDGTIRVNVATKLKEIFRAGFWLPYMDFIATQPECTARTVAFLQHQKIQFVPGSDKLDSVSLATINHIAGLLHHCTAGNGMIVVIGGHTDSQGDDNMNYRLSVGRANAVRNALLKRGLQPDRLMAFGYGETQPVADNATPEGRAKNRRTTFVWLNPIQH